MASEPNHSTIVLVSGMAADAEVFAPQAVAFPGLIVPEWIEPRWDEGLKEYCQRLATTIEIAPNAVLGGASFGGMVALEISAHLRPKTVVLIGSIRSPDELPLWIRGLRPLAPLIRWAPVQLGQLAIKPLGWRGFKKRFPHLAGVARQVGRADSRLLRWSLRELLRWQGVPEVDCQVLRIHGDRDRVLPPSRVDLEQLIHGAGHVISLTHPSEVNAVLRAACRMD